MAANDSPRMKSSMLAIGTDDIGRIVSFGGSCGSEPPVEREDETAQAQVAVLLRHGRLIDPRALDHGLAFVGDDQREIGVDAVALEAAEVGDRVAALVGLAVEDVAEEGDDRVAAG